MAHGVRCATDITGFGLLGHGLEVARASGTRLAFQATALPALDGALEAARAGVETAGAGHNRRFTDGALEMGAGVPPELVALALDPQTSGGLLAAVAPAAIGAIEADLSAAGIAAWRVGDVEAPKGQLDCWPCAETGRIGGARTIDACGGPSCRASLD